MKKANINGISIEHNYPFDPSYGYQLEELLAVDVPSEPEGFVDYWTQRYQRTLETRPDPRLKDTGKANGNWRIFDLAYTSTDNTPIHGWALLPASGPIHRGFVIGHGYGGREGPDFHLPFSDAALLFPCSRGISRSRNSCTPENPLFHVIHGIEDRDRYILAGCVDDLWLSVSALLELFPDVIGSVGLLGISFSGGISVLAAPWDRRIARCHVNVPTFGHQALRMALPTVGSGLGVQAYAKRNPGVVEKVLPYFDAAVAGRHLMIPTLCACARFDPSVAPPGQFAIYNSLPPNARELFPLTAGHHPHPKHQAEEADLLQKLCAFFAQ